MALRAPGQGVERQRQQQGSEGAQRITDGQSGVFHAGHCTARAARGRCPKRAMRPSDAAARIEGDGRADPDDYTASGGASRQLTRPRPPVCAAQNLMT
ncbi:hypothetical protein [Lysobacter gummosus]|uniref:hypothetical protein n=1 Tax=Lysobacter gummosus TaxID=262324 RepID=UPI003627ABCE